MNASTIDGQNILELLEEKIMEWELDRGQDKIAFERKILEINKSVEKIKAMNCGPCEE